MACRLPLRSRLRAESLTHGRFRNVQTCRPAGAVKQVTAFLRKLAELILAQAGVTAASAANP